MCKKAQKSTCNFAPLPYILSFKDADRLINTIIGGNCMSELEISRIYSKVFQSSMVAIGITDIEGNYIMVNPAWCNFMGYTEEEALKLNVNDVTVEEDLKRSDRSMKNLANGTAASIRIKRQFKRKDGKVFWAELHVSPLLDDDGQTDGIIGMLINIDRQVKAEKKQKVLNRKLEKLARHDPLTGLYNRRAISEIMERQHRIAKRYSRGFAVAVADLDDFKQINDTYGHQCGDMVLKRLAQIFLKWIRDTDSVGRWGGEEFLFVFAETDCDGAITVAERIRKSLDAELFEWDGHKFRISITIGISYRTQQTTIQEMIEEADKATYEGKANGKNQVVCKRY
jgi:diguanylate cyclase (GGDEF)-like protein/PAS domain S-box-containing protein